MQTPTNRSSRIDRLIFEIINVVVLSAVLVAVASSSVAAPAMRWVKVAGEQMLASFVG